MKAVILARVSTKEQELGGFSLTHQLETLTNYAERKDFEVAKIFKFSETASQSIRRKFEEVLNFLDENKEKEIHLLCYNVSRLTRNWRDAVDIDKRIVENNLVLHFVKDDLILNKDSSGAKISIWENSVHEAKQQINKLKDYGIETKEYKIRKGELPGKAPIGYKNIKVPIKGGGKRGDVVVDETRAPFIRKYFEEYTKQIYSIKDLTEKAYEWGLRNSNDNKVSVSKMHSVLHDKFYCGIMTIKGKEYPHVHERIIPIDLFNKCQDILNSKEKKHIKYSKKPFIFRGLIRCAHCNSTITTEEKVKKSGKSYRYLFCSKHEGECKKWRVNENEILDQIESVFNNIKIPPSVAKELDTYLEDMIIAKKDFYHARVSSLNRRYEQIQVQMDNLLNLLTKNIIEEEEFIAKRSELKEEKQLIHMKIKDVEVADEEFMITIRLLMKLTDTLPELFKSSKIDQKRAIINYIFWNPKLNVKNLDFSIRKPFDMFIKIIDNPLWRTRKDSNSQPPDP